MHRFNETLLFGVLLVAVTVLYGVSSLGAGCADDATCTDYCGYAGQGKCVNGTHCVCESCPQRSTAELVAEYSMKTCIPEPLCQVNCPASSFNYKSGKIYSGHVCSSKANLEDMTCICFCMPTTLASLGTVIRCPVVPGLNNTTLDD